MSTVHMPKPPAGHYWRIDLQSYGSKYRRVNLVRSRKWWFDKVVQWGVMVPVSDEHANAQDAVKAALYVLGKYHEGHGDATAELNGLTGYVDHRGRLH